MTRDSIRRRQTRGFVEYKQESIVLSRSAKVRTTTGGWRRIVDANLDPQVMTLIPFAQGSPAVVPGDGQDERYDYTIIAPYGSDIVKGDTFTFNDVLYRVSVVLPDDGQMVRALAVSHGG